MEIFVPYDDERTLPRRNISSAAPPPSTRRNLNPDTLPQALPCRRFYQLHPEKVGPLANVVISDPKELEPWLLVAQPVKAKKAMKHGGCIVYVPKASAGTRKDAASVKPRYYSLTGTDDEVYGRGVYLPRRVPSQRQSTTRKARAMRDSFYSDTSVDGCTEEREGQEASSCTTRAPSRCNSTLAGWRWMLQKMVLSLVAKSETPTFCSD